mgnify:CR=1 FL=1
MTQYNHVPVSDCLSHVHDESETWTVQAGTRHSRLLEVGVGRVCS